MTYTERVLDELKARYPEQTEFIQAATEILNTLQPAIDAHPEYEQAALLERFVEPERVIMFRVPWVDDAGKVQVNRGYRVEFNSAIGPYKGGLRFNPTVTLGMLKFLGLEQILKNSLTTLPMGGGKGGSDFDPKGKSNNEIMHFCQSFMTELARHIGPNTDVPAGDLGVGGREVGYLFGQYKRIRDEWTGVLTGKGLSFGGSLARTEATGYGLAYFVDEYLKSQGDSFEGKNVVVHGSGNVAIYAVQKVSQLGGKVLACSDTHGWVEDPEGIDYQVLEHVYNKKRSGNDRGVTLAMYVDERPGATWHEGDGRGVWQLPCDIALPCARENTLHLEDAKALVANGVKAVGEGANMPTTIEATEYFQEHGVVFMPGKAANAGGVARLRPRDERRTPSTSPGRSRRSTASSSSSCAACSTTLPTRPRSMATRATSSWAPTSPAS